MLYVKLGVVILNWNGKKFLEKFLPTVIANTPSYGQVIIADNASTDDSIAFVKEKFPEVSIIQNSSNGGFAKGYNDALKQIDAEYYVLLNSDVEVAPNWVEPIITMMDADKTIAACQPKIKDFNNRKMFEYAGAAGGFIDKYGYPFCRGRVLDKLEEDKGQYDDKFEVFWATGAALFIRAECYHAVEGLDEDFFAHMEEIDLCWRLKNRGYKIMVQPKSVVYHVGGGTLNKINPHKTYLNFRNNLILLCKNHNRKYFLLKLLIRMILDGVAAVKFILSGELNNFFAVIKAHGKFYLIAKSTLEKRRKLQKEIQEYTTTAVYDSSIIADYFIRNKRTFKAIFGKGSFLEK